MTKSAKFVTSDEAPSVVLQPRYDGANLRRHTKAKDERIGRKRFPVLVQLIRELELVRLSPDPGLEGKAFVQFSK